MKLLLSICLALVGLAMGQKYKYWSHASCLLVPDYDRIFPEAQEIACDALESLQSMTDIGSVPDSDMRRAFEMIFNTRIDDPILYGASDNWKRRNRQNSYQTAYQRVEDYLNTFCYEWGELEQGVHKKEADMLIYCDENDSAVEYNGAYYDMVNGIRGSTVCNMPAMGVMEAHLWNHVLDGDYWADWNPDRVRVTLCDSVMAPVVLYKEGEMDMRDLSEWELGGQAIRSPTIDMWTRHVTTGTFLHEWTHAHPLFTDDVFERDPYTHQVDIESPYGWKNSVKKHTAAATINADNYLMFMGAAWLSRQKRFIVQHHQFLGGYALPRDDDVSTDEATKQTDIAEGRLRFYIDISTPGNPRARWA